MSEQLRLRDWRYATGEKLGAVEQLAEAGLRRRIGTGEPMFASCGRGYVAANVTGDRMTLRRQVPKAKGKRARRLERQARRVGVR